MASFSFSTIVSLLLFLNSCLPSAISSDLGIEECGSRLLLLAPCAPFVQGSSTSPAKSCCDNLVDLYGQQAGCLCVLLNNSADFPINQTLALELPRLCDLNANDSSCPGLLPLLPSSPKSQVINGSTANSSIAASPSMALPPGSNMLFGRNSGEKLKIKGATYFALAAISLMLMEISS